MATCDRSAYTCPWRVQDVRVFVYLGCCLCPSEKLAFLALRCDSMGYSSGSLTTELTSVPTLTSVASHQDSGFLDAGKSWRGAAHWQPVDARISVASHSVSWGCFGLLSSQIFGAGWEHGSRFLPPCWPMTWGFSPLPRSSQISGAGWLLSGALCWQGLDSS